MYLPVTAINKFTQTLPDFMYASQICALIIHAHVYERGTDVTFFQFQILLCLSISQIHIFYDHDDNNVPPTYPMRFLGQDI